MRILWILLLGLYALPAMAAEAHVGFGLGLGGEVDLGPEASDAEGQGQLSFGMDFEVGPMFLGGRVGRTGSNDAADQIGWSAVDLGVTLRSRHEIAPRLLVVRHAVEADRLDAEAPLPIVAVELGKDVLEGLALRGVVVDDRQADASVEGATAAAGSFERAGAFADVIAELLRERPQGLIVSTEEIDWLKSVIF